MSNLPPSTKTLTHSKPTIYLSNLSSAAAALRIPTIKPKTIIKYTTMTSRVQHQQLCRQTPQDASLPIMEKTCGLFNTIEPTNTPENDMFALDMETNMNIESFFTNNHTTVATVNPNDILANNNSPKKTFAQKLKEANLNINTSKPTPSTTTTSFSDDKLSASLDHENAELSQIFTPTTMEKILFEISGSNIIGENITNTTTTATDADNDNTKSDTEFLDDLLGFKLDHDFFESCMTDAPALAPAPPATSVTAVVSSSVEKIDHAYSAKRPRTSSSVFDFEAAPGSVLSSSGGMTDLDASMMSTDELMTPNSGKRQRTKGIYRACDVRNDFERANYLERRTKNNISSKISRANKKNYFSEMEARCESMGVENRQLTVKSEKMTRVVEMMRNYIKDAIVNNSKNE